MALTELRDFVVAMLHHHHDSEDGQLWPLVIEIAPELADALADLSAEHQQLDTALEALAESPIDDGARANLTAAAVTVRDLVRRHLDREEPVLFPALRTRIPEDAWDEFSRQTVATSPPEAAPLVVAFLDRVGTAAEVVVVFGSLPEPARELVAANRRQGQAVLDALEATRS
jgi:iron-sulfur cluster repair protein YtfE (RIC family)